MYNILIKTKKYQLVQTGEKQHRIENLKGLYTDEVSYIEIPISLVEVYQDIWEEYKYAEKGYKREAKLEAIMHFDHMNDLDFENEHAELYPEQYK